MPRALPAGSPPGHSPSHARRQAQRPAAGDVTLHDQPNLRNFIMLWTAPQATDLRFGFEITMYVSAR